jgi:hypothetical protein
MGEARRRGTYEERRDESIRRNLPALVKVANDCANSTGPFRRTLKPKAQAALKRAEELGWIKSEKEGEDNE